MRVAHGSKAALWIFLMGMLGGPLIVVGLIFGLHEKRFFYDSSWVSCGIGFAPTLTAAQAADAHTNSSNAFHHLKTITSYAVDTCAGASDHRQFWAWALIIAGAVLFLLMVTTKFVKRDTYGPLRRREADSAVLATAARFNSAERARKLRLLSRHACLSCGCPTLEDRGGYDICTVCFWEDDGSSSVDQPSGPNHGYTLRRAARNVAQTGTMYDATDGIRPGMLTNGELVTARAEVFQAADGLAQATDEHSQFVAARLVARKVDQYIKAADRAR